MQKEIYFSLPSVKETFKIYFLLTKPGIIIGNLITTAGGFALASKGSFSSASFLTVLLGISLVIASACVFNNYIDRDFDKKMERTKGRAFASGLVSSAKALLFAGILGILGMAVLGQFMNLITMGLAFFGFAVYVFFYSYSKHHSTYGTLIGSIAGAVPPVVGYYAAGGKLDLGALLMFAIVVFWQMPHFYAIAVFRLEEYKAASIPVLPVKKGLHQTKVQMILYIAAFSMASFLLFSFGYAGYFYLAISIILNLYWFVLAFESFKTKNDRKWARKMFAYSLIVITALCAVIPFSS